MQNIVIQTKDGELTLFYTDGGIERAEEVVKVAGLYGDVEDIFEVPDRDLEHYCFDGRVWDNEKV